jgi:peptidoglycan hydrolase-like protein with peptidoglycan-binding domain
MKYTYTLLLVLTILTGAMLPNQNGASAQTTTSANVSNCSIFTRSLFLGASDRFTNGEVSRLQSFLISRNYLSYGPGPTGYFGFLTYGALRRFQQDNGISAIGIAGPLTRARIQAVSCGGTVPPGPVTSAPTISYISPSSGNVGTQVTIYGSRFTSDNTVNFGIGIIPHVASQNGTSITFVTIRSLRALSWNPSACPATIQCRSATATARVQISFSRLPGRPSLRAHLSLAELTARLPLL